jgi:L-threonylcarbamoyladenylate synthase
MLRASDFRTTSAPDTVYLVTEIVSADSPGVVDLAVEMLSRGELVCYPTDTVYGIGAAATNERAVRRLFAVKGRAPDKALPLLIASAGDASLIAEVTPTARKLMEQFWPGGLTIVMRKLPQFQSMALAGEQTVGLRVPDHDLVRAIVRVLGEPITGTSANRSGARAPRSAQEAALQLGDMVSLVIDGGPAKGGIESTVVDITDGPRVLREGAVSKEALEEALGRKLL